MSSNRIKGQEIQMGDSFVLPIEQTRVTQQQAKVQQILQETDAQAKQILAAAENKSQVVVQTANTEAEHIIEEARKKAQQEYDMIKNHTVVVRSRRSGDTILRGTHRASLKKLFIDRKIPKYLRGTLCV